MWLTLQNPLETNKENPQSSAKNVVTLSGNLKSRILQSDVSRHEIGGYGDRGLDIRRTESGMRMTAGASEVETFGFFARIVSPFTWKSSFFILNTFRLHVYFKFVFSRKKTGIYNKLWLDKLWLDKLWLDKLWLTTCTDSAKMNIVLFEKQLISRSETWKNFEEIFKTF